jgi:hypothetical protein
MVVSSSHRTDLRCHLYDTSRRRNVSDDRVRLASGVDNLGAWLVLETLTPAERLAFVLHDPERVGRLDLAVLDDADG